MYVIKKWDHVTDTIKVEGDDKDLIVRVDIHVQSISRKYSELYKVLETAQGALTQAHNGGDPDSIVEADKAFSQAVIALFNLLFGADQVQAIIDHYGGDLLEMFAAFTPYLRDELIPRIVKAQNQIAAQKYSK